VRGWVEIALWMLAAAALLVFARSVLKRLR
jgi:hypothetical protein